MHVTLRSAIVLAIACFVNARDVHAQAPRISSISPEQGHGGDTLIVRGTGFAANGEVRFQLSATTMISAGLRLVTSDTLIKIRLNHSAISQLRDPVNVIVNTSAGRARSPKKFVPIPAIRSFSVGAEPGRAAMVTVIGAGLWRTLFAAFTSSNGLVARSWVNSGSDTILVFAIPANAATGPISLVSKYGAVTSKDNFEPGRIQVVSVDSQPPPSGAPPAAAPPPLPAPQTTESTSPLEPGCGGGCFNATATGASTSTMRGRAAVETDDGERFRIVFRSAKDEGHYVALTRELGGVPASGAFVIANSCGQRGDEDASRIFVAEYFLDDYHEGEPTRFAGMGGSVTIESITATRVRGRFSIMACRQLADDKVEETRVRGTFDAVR